VTLSDQELPTIHIIGDVSTRQSDTATSIVYETATTTGSGIVEVEYYIKTDEGGSDNTTSELLIQLTNSHTDDSIVEFTTTNKAPDLDDTMVDLFKSETQPKEITLPTDLFLYSASVGGTMDFKTHYRLNLGTITNSRDMLVDLTLAEAKYFETLTDIYCAASGTLYSIGGDIRYQSGTIHDIDTDMYVSNLGLKDILCDIYNTYVTTSGITVDLQQASGTFVRQDVDIYSSVLSTTSFGSDFKTRSLFIDGFFLVTDEFTAASGVGYVDIVDYIYDVDETTISIVKDGTTLSGITIQDIPNGKRAFFDPLDNFYSDGEIIVTVYAESTYGEVLEEDFYLLYGYDLELSEEGIFWDASTRIYVTATASNGAVCPNTEGAHYYFDTAELPSINLTAFVNAVEYRDLSCSIYPRSTAFYYGQTYTVKVSGVKDFHGNQMEPFTYTFTIESP
jgi:hypothetical protein